MARAIIDLTKPHGLPESAALKVMPWPYIRRDGIDALGIGHCACGAPVTLFPGDDPKNPLCTECAEDFVFEHEEEP